MTISRGQMPRQLYGLGSLVKSVTKAAKGIVKGVKDVAKSPIGKAAMLYFAPSLIPGGAATLGGVFSNMGGLAGLKTALIGAHGGTSRMTPGILGKLGITGGGGAGLTGFGKILGLTIPSVLAAAGVEDEKEIAELKQDKPALTAALERGYRNLNPGVSDEEVAEFVRTYSAEGGRIGYAEGNPDQKQMAMVEDMLKRGMDVETIKSITGASDEIIQDRINFIKYGGAKVPIKKAYGGRIGYAFGDSAEDNAIQASGIMGLPLNQNPAGVTELDLRETGGFIPPVGVKEKADDIPAMLSNNEFVFTADAVRGMGGGDVDKGAERMYAMMKTLENGGRV